MDDNNAPWFNLFRISVSLPPSNAPMRSSLTYRVPIVFELVSAFGGIGLTLGIPTENFSFSGSLGPLSKLVVIVIMVRGRHRGLPVAIDRASACGWRRPWVAPVLMMVCSHVAGRPSH